MIAGYYTAACPFCGATSAFLYFYGRNGRRVRCGRCGATGPESGHGDDGAVERWNGRALRPVGPGPAARREERDVPDLTRVARYVPVECDDVVSDLVRTAHAAEASAVWTCPAPATGGTP